jgi:hypothetical protein
MSPKSPKISHPFALKRAGCKSPKMSYLLGPKKSPKYPINVPKCPIKVPKCPTSLSFERVGGVLVWVALALELVDSVVLRHLVVVNHMPAVCTTFSVWQQSYCII